MEDLFLVQMLFKSRDDVVKGSYFLTPVESLDYMINTPAMQGDPYPGRAFLTDMTGVSPGTLLYFDRKENSVWYGGDGVGYIFLIRDGQKPLIWEVETYKEKAGLHLPTELRITKKDRPQDSWEHEPDYIYHKFYQDFPSLEMQLLNWFGTEWKKLLEASP